MNLPISWKSRRLVGLQFGMVGILLWQSDLTFNIASVSCFVVGGILGGWAVLTMGLGNFNVVPDVKLNARLVHQSFPYRLLRHPMYMSLFILSAGCVLQPFSLLKLLELLILAIILDSKARYEEFLLSHRFAEYAHYQRNSYRFIPYIY